MNRAWLHRRGKPTWMFEPSKVFDELVHITAKGTAYAIIADHKRSKPFWVGRLIGTAWCTCERELRARSIEFESTGEYIFPK